EMAADTQARAGRNVVFRYGDRVAACRHYDHHLTHAATACWSSPFSEAVCAVVDGFGEGASVALFHYRNGDIERIQGPTQAWTFASLGELYADVCRLCGFDPWKGEEWKVMGLAPYGEHDPYLYRNLRNCIAIEDLRLVRPVQQAAAMARVVRRARKPDKSLLSAANMAATGQQVFEELMLTLCQRLWNLGLSDHLILSGGCALNSSFNGKVVADTSFSSLFVPSAPADDGNAIGSALLAYREDHPEKQFARQAQSAYLGSSVSRLALERAARGWGTDGVERLDELTMTREVSRRLAAGQLVGWVQGRAEFGPRALGNRSILADPRRPEMKDRINAAVKYRERFRPFAPSILHEHGPRYFEDYQDSPYMERTLRFRMEMASRVPAVVHINRTGRLQSVTAERNPRFYALLQAFLHETDVPLLLNTSFNVMGKPIIHSVEDAIAVFVTSELDALVIDDHLFFKARGEPCRPS
ncbi:MAG: hypothetical protein OEY28_12490, partial [Nitrospira sp.]|nr:hypothetical protein [Nitrospira sp.]